MAGTASVRMLPRAAPLYGPGGHGRTELNLVRLARRAFLDGIQDNGAWAALEDAAALADTDSRRVLLGPGAPSGHFQGNAITTSKYNIVTFLPIFLFVMFSRVAYLYFLLQARSPPAAELHAPPLRTRSVPSFMPVQWLVHLPCLCAYQLCPSTSECCLCMLSCACATSKGFLRKYAYTCAF